MSKYDRFKTIMKYYSLDYFLDVIMFDFYKSHNKLQLFA